MLGPRLVLGTAQLGMRYGINNRLGQPSQADAIEIVNAAWQGGIHEFDTAQSYGVSESVLGQAFAKIGIAGKAQVISKISPSEVSKGKVALDAALQGSLHALGMKSLKGLMLHDESQFDLWSHGLKGWFQEQQQRGLIERAGVSVYSPARALTALDTDGIDLVQIPSSIVDRRFEIAGVFRRAKELGKWVYLRSIFLQGALLMSPQELSDRSSFLLESVGKVHALAKKLAIPVTNLCFGYVIKKWPEAKIIIGAETAEQVRSNLRLAAQNYESLPLEEIEKSLGLFEEWILNPSLWP